MEGSSSLAQDAEAEATPLTFEDLFADQHARVFRALYLVVGNTHEAEELMQDAFLHVLERWDRIDDPAAYLYRSRSTGPAAGSDGSRSPRSERSRRVSRKTRSPRRIFATRWFGRSDGSGSGSTRTISRPRP